MDALEENNIEVTDEEFVELFNAWILSICDMYTAIGHTVDDEVRLRVRPNHSGYGLNKDWEFTNAVRKIMGWNDNSEEERVWKRVLKETFLDFSQFGNGKLYVDFSRVKPRFDADHDWYKCEQCSEITPYVLKGRCPSCGFEHIHKMESSEYEALSFWRRPVF